MGNLKGKFVTGKPVLNGFGAKPFNIALFIFSPLIFSFAVTCLFSGMRRIMLLGGFVATGGPYEIAHQAPDWVWIVPVSMFLLVFSIFSSMASSSKVQGPNLMSLSWSALFASLGWNFAEFGFGFGTGLGGELSIGWIICAVMFIPMGLIPLFFILRSYFLSSKAEKITGENQLPWGISLILQISVSVIGIWLGNSFFNSLQ